MNPQLEGAIRSLIIALGGVGAAAGYLKGVDWAAIASGVLAIVGLGWSLYSNSSARLVAQVAKTPEQTVVVTPDVAAAINEKLVVQENIEPMVLK